jgi:hypothetical protein
MTVSDPEVFVPSPRDGIAGRGQRLVEEGATSSCVSSRFLRLGGVLTLCPPLVVLCLRCAKGLLRAAVARDSALSTPDVYAGSSRSSSVVVFSRLGGSAIPGSRVKALIRMRQGR